MTSADQHFDNSKVAIRTFAGKGRGVVAAADIDKDELIVSAPVLVLSPVEYHLMRILPCIMHSFTWRDPKKNGAETAALAFGLVSLCNHSEQGANADAVRDYELERLNLVSLKPISAGDEVLIQYSTVPFVPH